MLWGIFMRTVVGLHATWLVNSATHVWGSRRFQTRDLSTNNWFVAILTFGEGWHNNHHAHPTSARHGLKWYEIDMNWYGIWALKKLGLAHQILVTEAETMRTRRVEGRHPLRPFLRGVRNWFPRNRRHSFFWFARSLHVRDQVFSRPVPSHPPWDGH